MSAPDATADLEVLADRAASLFEELDLPELDGLMRPWDRREDRLKYLVTYSRSLIGGGAHPMSAAGHYQIIEGYKHDRDVRRAVLLSDEGELFFMDGRPRPWRDLAPYPGGQPDGSIEPDEVRDRLLAVIRRCALGPDAERDEPPNRTFI